MKKIVIFILGLIIIFITSFAISRIILNMKSNKINEKENESKVEEENIVSEDKQENNIETSNKYYLHKSELEEPSKDKCLTAKKVFFDKIGEKEKKEIQTELRIHS